tara:strand:+ start:22892 stop:24160 length:1269 start_codon:yes stop_codon:yes gene_type:complete
MDFIGEGVAIIASGVEKTRNNDVNYIFRQDSTFWYFTGFEEPNSVVVLAPNTDKPYTMFVPPYDENYETWVGQRAGIEGAIGQYLADQAFPIEDLETRLPQLLSDTSTLYFTPNPDHDLDPLINKILSSQRRNHSRGGALITNVRDLSSITSNMRLTKTDQEITQIKKAIDITDKGFIKAFSNTLPGKYEYQIQASLESQFRDLGSPRNGYPSIVAGGSNSCTLHYIKNDEVLADGDLLLIDAGAEFDYYTADITRTWPINGKFSSEQLETYSIVLAAQEAAIKSIKPGITFEEVHQAALKILVQGLKDLGILKESLDSIIEEKSYAPYYMHATSHWLGLDVHDAGIYRNSKGSIKLERGMVLTVEPGLYFGKLAPNVPKQFQGIGIRIEDNILVTDVGFDNLSRNIPSLPNELEQLIGTGS